LARLGRTTEAGRAYREALRLKPDLAEARDELQRLESPHRSRQ
jgi:Flp pilus assembly protein TadD